MSIKRPGGLELTRYALTRAGATPGQSLLDIGCGDGSAARLAKDEFRLNVTAVDTDEKAVASAADKGIDARVMDAAALSIPSRSFDIVTMECVFSVLSRQEEAFHEAYCVLKPGGSLILSDVYRPRPDLDRWRREYREAMALFRRPRSEGDCENETPLPSPYCQDGALVLDGLQMLLDELDMETVLLEDRAGDLKAFLGQLIFDFGSIGKGLRELNCCRGEIGKGEGLGYFLLIARKKNA